MARLEKLEVVARKVMAGEFRGDTRTRRRGAGSLFRGHKSYAQGDDLRFLDWNVYSRLGELLVKEFDAEENLDLVIVLDASGSMDFGRVTTSSTSPAASSRRAGLSSRLNRLRQGETWLVLPKRGGHPVTFASSDAGQLFPLLERLAGSSRRSVRLRSLEAALDAAPRPPPSSRHGGRRLRLLLRVRATSDALRLPPPHAVSGYRRRSMFSIATRSNRICAGRTCASTDIETVAPASSATIGAGLARGLSPRKSERWCRGVERACNAERDDRLRSPRHRASTLEEAVVTRAAHAPEESLA